jgi:outer membrane receptor protein involved in Fe transport
LYQENWDNVQIAFFNPGVTGNIFFNTNGQNFRIRGIETSIVARVMDGLTLQASGAWNHSEQTNEPALIDNVPGSVNFGKAITEVCDGAGQNCSPVGSPFGPKGSPSANAPPLQYNIRARYEWSVGGYQSFVQAGVSHTAHSYTQAGANPTLAQAGLTTSRLRFELEPYTLVEASVGVAKGNLNASLYVENLGNSKASTFTSTDQFIVEETPLRPRTIGVTFGCKF